MKFAIFLIILAFSLFVSRSYAGYAEAMEAIKQDDPTKAFQELSKAASENDTRAYFTLGLFHELGVGTAKDDQAALRYYNMAAEAGDSKAWKKLAVKLLFRKGIGEGPAISLYWANLSAKSGDAEGQFLVYQIIRATDMNHFGPNNQPNPKKYDELAKRPVKHRYKDKLAYEMLYRSSLQGYLPAVVMQAAVYGDNIGTDNRKKLQAAILELLNNKNFKQGEQFKSVIDTAVHIDTLGESLVTSQIWRDTMTPAMMAASIQLGINPSSVESCKSAPSKVSKIKISKKLTDAEYLPIDIPELLSTFLLRGNWEETWEIELCGKSTSIPIEFTADGMGGAKFKIKPHQMSSTTLFD